MWQSSWHHVCRWDIVPHDFFQAKSTKQLCNLSRVDNGHKAYHAMKHKQQKFAQITPNDRSKSGMIICQHTWPTKWLPPHSINMYQKTTDSVSYQIPCLKYIWILWYDVSIQKKKKKKKTVAWHQKMYFSILASCEPLRIKIPSHR